MVTNKRNKSSRQRGSHTHGWGSMKKHRGAGSRGGKGMAGTGKRGDAKKPRIWKNKKYFGKYGFKKKGMGKNIIYINLNYIEDNYEKLLAQELIEKKDDTYIIDGTELGFTKVLGYGKLTKKLKITADSFSKNAIEKIKSAGGDAIIANESSQEEEKAKDKGQQPAEEAE